VLCLKDEEGRNKAPAMAGEVWDGRLAWRGRNNETLGQGALLVRKIVVEEMAVISDGTRR
jgi:hypothetical protein